MSIVGMAGRPMPAASDIDLVQALREGDDEAFEELYRRYHARISNYVRGMVRDDARAEDVIQEAFVSALGSIRRSDCEIQFKPWIYEIARNKAIDAHRRTSRSVEVSFDVDAELDAPEALRPGDPHAPESCLMDRERFDNFRGALDELSDTHHRIILLRELEGLSYREIGARMQLSAAAVESALFRARRKLEHEFEQLDTGRRCRLVRASIARLAEGVESGSDRRRLDRHARRCWSCRRCAHQLGVEPVSQRPARRGVAALLPLPAFLRRFVGGQSQAAGSGQATAREAVGAVAAPSWEAAAQGVQKAAAVVASAVAIGGGGATLGGVGPLAVDGGRAAPEASTDEPSSASRQGVAARWLKDRSTGPRASGSSRSHHHHSRQGHGHRRDAAPVHPGARSKSPGSPAGRPAAVPARSALPPVDAGPLLPAASRPDVPVVPRKGATQPLGGGGSLPNVPTLPALPTDPVGAGGQVQTLAPDLPVEPPRVDAKLPLP